MSRSLFTLFACFCMLSNLHAQKKPCNTASKTYTNHTYRNIFASSGIERITVRFEKENPVSLSVYKSSLRESADYNKESYDLEFEGDVYLLKKKYNLANIPALPKEEIAYMTGMQRCRINYTLTADIYKNSVVYQFSQCCPVDEKNDVYITRVKLFARYTGDLKQLAETLEKRYNEKVHRPAGDSVLIFRGFVSRDACNYLEQVTLLEGIKSPFSDLVQQALEESGKLWVPMIQGGRYVRSYVRIYARLNGDGSLTLSTGG